LSEADAQRLLCVKLGASDNQEDIAELAEALEYMPLAIVQAAAYIRRRAPRYSVEQYLEQFRKSNREMMGLLDFEGGQLRRDREASNSIILTWQITFNQILLESPAAASLLSLMNFFDRQGIHECLLDPRGWVADQDENEQNLANEQLENDLQTLVDYSLVSISVDRSSFEMYRLVQLSTRQWL
jgi:hypothetical protein